MNAVMAHDYVPVPGDRLLRCWLCQRPIGDAIHHAPEWVRRAAAHSLPTKVAQR